MTCQSAIAFSLNEEDHGRYPWVAVGFYASIGLRLHHFCGGFEHILIDPHSPSTLYAVKWRDGIYKSTDSGSSWFASNNGLPADASGYIEIFSLAIDPLTPSTLYAGTYGGVYKSTDSGNNWSASSAGLSELYGLSYTQVDALSIDPLTPSTLYAGTNGAGVYKSTDNGNIWTAMNNGLSNLIVSSLAIDPLTPSSSR